MHSSNSLGKREGMVWVLLVCAVATAHAGQVTLVLEEPLRRQWQPAVVHLRTSLPNYQFLPKTFRLTDEKGHAVPMQISDVFKHPERQNTAFSVWVRTGLEPWQVRRWVLHFGEGKGASPGTDLKVAREGDTWVLSNRQAGVRVLAGKRTYAPACDPRQVPAPIQALRGRSGTWIGRGWLEGPQKVVAYQADVSAQGPIFAEVTVRYTFEGGRYVVRTRLDCQDNVIMVKEEFDLGDPSPARDQHFCFSFHEGLNPDTLRWRGRYWDKSLAVNQPKSGYRLSQEAVAPLRYGKDRDLVRILGLFLWWPESACCWALYRTGEPKGDLVGVFRARPSYWRNPTAMFLKQRAKPDVYLACPIRQPEQDWLKEGVDYNSPYYTGEVAPGTPRSLGRRQWGILLSTPAEVVAPNDDMTQSGLTRAMIRHGSNPLDKVKDWALRWADPGAKAYPRAWIRREQLPDLRRRVAKDPDLQRLLTSRQHWPFTYLVKPDPKLGQKLLHETARGDANWMGVLPMLRYAVDKYLTYEGDLGIHTMMHHALGSSRRAAPLFDVAMSVPEMSAAERREARALMAFLAYKLADPDWMAKDSGFHLGNPNMPTAAENQMGYLAALLPNHPQATAWAMRTIRNATEMLRDYVAPGGAWRECLHYQHDAAMNQILFTALPLRNSGLIDLFRNPGLKSTMLYAAQILTPVDPRFGVRTVPSIGNSGHEVTSNFGRMAAGTRRSDPTYSAWMQWAHNAMGGPRLYKLDELFVDADLPARQPDLASRVFPGFGAVLRAHVGTKHETYVSFRIGKWVEHYENDQGSIVFHSKGVPLCDDFGSIYQPTMLRPWMHNRIAIDHKLDWEARGHIVDHALLDAADAVTGMVPVSRLHPIPEDPWERTPPNAPYAPPVEIPLVTWTRQLLLVKDADPLGANYLLVRDTFGAKPTRTTEFTLWCLAKGVKLAGAQVRYTGQLGVNLDVTFIDPKDPTCTTGEYAHKSLSYNGGTWRKTNPGKKWEERQTYVRTKRGPGQGYFAALYPRLPKEPAPTFRAWAGGAGVAATIGTTRHVAILAPRSGTYREGDTTLAGRQALVRRSPGRTELVLLCGTRVACGDIQVEGAAPCTVVVAGGKVGIQSNLLRPATLRLQLPEGARPPGARRRGAWWELDLPRGKHHR